MIFNDLISQVFHDLPAGLVTEVCIGLHWTAVVVEVDGEHRCGLASTLTSSHGHMGEPDIPAAGGLEGLPAAELAAHFASPHPVRRSLGLATVNALLPRKPADWVDQHAEEIILSRGAGKRVALIGHFPFVPRLRSELKYLDVLDLHPLEGDLPASAAPQVLPQADVVAITAMTLLNGTFEDLLKLCPPQAQVLLIGPSTPLSPVLFEWGIHVLAGAIVERIEPVMQVISQGGNFRQVRKAGVRLVTLRAESAIEQK